MASINDSYILSLNFASSTTYFDTSIPLIIIGVLGGLMTVIIFRSLRIYRQSSSAFYLMIVSTVNIGQLVTGLLPRLFVNGFGIYWSESFDAFCKIRYSLFQACSVISPTCLCLATIDQFLGTSSKEEWRKWSDIRIAHYSCLITIIFWFLNGIPYAIFYSPHVSAWTGVISSHINLDHQSIVAAQLRFAVAVTTSIYYVYYSIPFYLYISVSERFRRQCRYVLIHLYWHRCRKLSRNTVEPAMICPISEQPVQPLTIEQIELTSECFPATSTQ